MKILIVDDSSYARSVMKRALGDHHTLVEASDGEKALELFQLEKPDLVFLDITMTGLNGMEVLEKMHSINPQAKVLMVTADVQEATRQEAFDRGAIGYLTKPYEARDLQQIVATVFEQ